MPNVYFNCLVDVREYCCNAFRDRHSVGLPSGQIGQLSYRWVDPSLPRPAGDLKEIPLGAVSFISYHLQVAQLRGIETAPADLESTSLMLAYGLDLFFTRVTPAGRFDLLSDDFNYFALVLTTIGVVAGTILMVLLNRIQSVNKAWS